MIVETKITYKYLMNKTKWDLAHMIMDLLDENDELRKRVESNETSDAKDN